MRTAPSLALAGLVLLVPLGQASQGVVLAEEEGRLLVGTGGVGIGSPAEAADVPPVSHAVHPFTTTCERGLLATVTWSSVTNATLGVPEHALVQVELREASGSVLASSFDDDGDETIGTGLVEPGDYELHLFHLAGEPLRYHALVEGKSSGDC